eukprot:GFYU01001573.1.p1 GENE.GFYU01001573.1~~GFYU01001573.1.p1  ORF type:complete len:418 (+),score=129.97 GFYU01001573.1:30-1256(+)
MGKDDKQEELDNLFGSDSSGDEEFDPSSKKRPRDESDSDAGGNKGDDDKPAKDEEGGGKKKKGKKKDKGSKKKEKGSKKKKKSKRRSAEDEANDDPIADSDHEARLAREESPSASEAEEAGSGSEPENEFDRIMYNAKKSKRRKTTDKSDAEIKQTIVEFLDQMNDAADEDIRRNREGEPAVAKLQLLPEMSAQLRKIQLWDQFLESGVLAVLKKWLYPMPDKSLPSLQVRTTVLEILLELPVYLDKLKACGIGKIVRWLIKHPHETKENAELANKVVERWCRPLFNRSMDYRDLEQIEEVEHEERPKPKRVESTTAVEGSISTKIHAAKPGDPDFILKARIPRADPLDFRRKPKSKETPVAKPAHNKAKMQKWERQFASLKKPGALSRANARAVKVSVEGRGLASHV